MLFERYVAGDDGGGLALPDTTSIGAGQTFTIGNTGDNYTHSITSVKLELYRDGSPGTLTISIKAVDESGKPTGGDLTSGSTDGDTLTEDTDGEWREVSLTPYKLNASTQYALVLIASEGGMSDNVHWRRKTGGGYAGGALHYYNGMTQTWSDTSGHDCMFEESGVPRADLSEVINISGNFDVPNWKTFEDAITLTDSMYSCFEFTVTVLKYSEKSNNFVQMALKVDNLQKESLEGALKYAGRIAKFNRPFRAFQNFDATGNSNNIVGFSINSCPSGLTSFLTLIVSNFSSKIVPGSSNYIFEISGYKFV